MMKLRESSSVAILLVALGLQTTGCGETEYVEGDPDFFITIQLGQNFSPRSVDRFVLTLTDATMLLDDSEGEIYDGGITWQTTTTAAGDTLEVVVTGDYFQQNAIEAPGGVHELDVPFLGGLDGPEALFGIEGHAQWRDDSTGDLEEIGYGTALLEMPPEPGSTVTVEVACLTSADWGWTCRTGCAPAANQCLEGIEQCGTGNFECIDGCCVSQD